MHYKQVVVGSKPTMDFGLCSSEEEHLIQPNSVELHPITVKANYLVQIQG